ncbi:MAG: hypothetical protein IJ394_01910 [Bacteroidales bacterium]|nr:hypothetical protein [Bacteroidales bacterium]
MLHKTIILISMLLLGGTMAFGQENSVAGQSGAASGQARQDSIAAPEGPGFNAMNYSMQKRNRPQGQPFVSERFSDNSYLSLGVGAKTLYPRAGYHYSLGQSATLGYGKWINAYNALKLTVTGSTFTRKENNGRFLTGEAYISHMFNFIGYLSGHNPKRPFEISTVEGLGYNLSYYGEQITHAFGAHIGLNFEFAFSEHADLYIEPLATFYTDAVDHSGDLNWHKYDLGFSASVGINFKFDSGRRVRILMEKDEAAKAGRKRSSGLFVTLMTGGQFQNSSIVHENVGLLESVGQHTGLSVGRWFNRMFALRGTAFFSNDKWNIHDEILYPARYMGMRAEAMVDLIGIFSRNENRWFSLPVIAGPEVGFMNKTDYQDNNLNRYYIGITAGFQTRFLIAKHLDMFLEPKFSMVPYSIASDTYIDNTKKTTDYFDGIVSLSFGLGYKF